MFKKLFEKIYDFFYPIQGPNETIHTEKIKLWLKTDQKRKWTTIRDEPNFFTSDDGKAMYIYEDKVEYWEKEDDIKCYTVPSTRAELFLMF